MTTPGCQETCHDCSCDEGDIEITKKDFQEITGIPWEKATRKEIMQVCDHFKARVFQVSGLSHFPFDTKRPKGSVKKVILK